MGVWAVSCGALASNSLEWEADHLLNLALVLLLAELAWGSLWDLTAGTDWFRPLTERWPPSHPAPLPVLPFTQPGSPAGRLGRGLGRLVAWWREVFWPVAGPSFLGLLAAILLAVVLGTILPDRLRPLNAILVALIGLGLVQRRRSRDSLAGTAAVQVGLCWLAGHMALVDVGVASLALALFFSLAVWGALRAAHGLAGALWLQNGGQVAAAALLVVLRQPLAAGAVGMLLLGQVALQPSLRHGGDPARIFRRTWPWLMGAMLLAALAVP
jgi:hypothetical protein